MLYSILRPIMHLFLSAFFRRIEVIGEENIVKDGPAIFVANHPNAVIDPLVVAVVLKRQVHFLAGANWFGKGLKAKIFKEQFNMIPVYRPWLAKGEKVSNDDMFRDCYEHLSNGDCIALFPEASSITVSKIRELKTGAARVKLGYEQDSNYSGLVPIIPVGLTYSNPHQFQSRLVVKIGEPVDFHSSVETTDPKEVAREMTSKIEEALKDTIVHIDNDENTSLVRKVQHLLVDTFRADSSVSHQDSEANFEFAQKVAKAVKHFETTDEKSFDNVVAQINAYFKELKKYGLADANVSESEYLKSSIAKWMLLIIGFPLFVVGVVAYYLPYLLAKVVYWKKFIPMMTEEDEDGKLDTSFTGSLIFLMGLLIFVVWTTLLSLGVAWLAGHWLAGVVALVLGYPIMRFALYYAKIALRVKQDLKGKKIRREYKEELSALSAERKRLIGVLREFREQFLVINS
jgi:glycerol-3-phosphate O-acyltransferase / dihydroxyacetone phosphate acyltransferase